MQSKKGDQANDKIYQRIENSVERKRKDVKFTYSCCVFWFNRNIYNIRINMEVIMKIKNILNKFNKYIEKNTKNINWQTRYKNLNKKYEEALKEIDDLKLQLDNDRNVNLIKEKNKYIKTLQRQREILREENLRMINNG